VSETEIKTIGSNQNVFELEYRADGKVFRYFGVPLSTFRALVRRKRSLQHWIQTRSPRKHQQSGGIPHSRNEVGLFHWPHPPGRAANLAAFPMLPHPRNCRLHFTSNRK